MEIKVRRFSSTGRSTLSLIFVDDIFQCYGLEDAFKEQKVKGQTRIPAGRYRLTFREEMTPKTQRYREKHSWFAWHLWVRDVPNFEYIYHHIGNDTDDTAGCLLLGNMVNNNKITKAFLAESTKAFELYYKKVGAALEAGEEVWVEYTDEDGLR